MRQSSGPFRFLLFVLAVIVTGAATLMGIKLGYGLLVLFVVVGSSLFLVFISLMLRPMVKSDRARTRLRPADPGFSTYVMAPMDVYPGYCWQCGRRVKLDSVVCLRCGATQMHRQVPERVLPSESAPWEIPPAPRFSGGMTRWDPSQGTPQPWGPPPATSGSPWQQPASPAPEEMLPQPPRESSRRSQRQPPRQPARQVRPNVPVPQAPQASPAQRVAPRYRPGAPPPWMPQRERDPAPVEPARRRRRR